MSSKKERIQASKSYLSQHVDTYMSRLVVDLLRTKPEDVLVFMSEWCRKEIEYRDSGVERPASLTDLNGPKHPGLQVITSTPGLPQEQDPIGTKSENSQNLLSVQKENSQSSLSDDESEEDAAELEKKKAKAKMKIPRGSVSAEAYGSHNIKGSYTAKVIEKSPEVTERIRSRLTQAFMFAALDETEKNIVIGAMEECKFNPDDVVIKQGDDGDVLYCVDSGKLKCSRRVKADDSEDTYLKTYIPGEAFGELALLYNAPRAATIICEEESICFSLDRDCFNNIVKDSAIKRRKRYDEFLSKLELLETLDSFERNKLGDAMKTEQYNLNEFIVREGEIGDKFYFIEEGTAIAVKDAPEEECESPLKRHRGQEPEAKEQLIVFEYKENDYFGELSLLHETPRAASIKVTSDYILVSVIDRFAFKRLLGPLEDMLKRNTEKYQKYEDEMRALADGTAK
jgi:cAMP-dependent protein kinase regulator